MCTLSLDRPKPEFTGVVSTAAEAADETFMCAIGGMLPIALCGQTLLQSLRHLSILERALSSVRNQCVFRHSVINLPLKDSIQDRSPDPSLPVNLRNRRSLTRLTQNERDQRL